MISLEGSAAEVCRVIKNLDVKLELDTVIGLLKQEADDQKRLSVLDALWHVDPTGIIALAHLGLSSDSLEEETEKKLRTVFASKVQRLTARHDTERDALKTEIGMLQAQILQAKTIPAPAVLPVPQPAVLPVSAPVLVNEDDLTPYTAPHEPAEYVIDTTHGRIEVLLGTIAPQGGVVAVGDTHVLDERWIPRNNTSQGAFVEITGQEAEWLAHRCSQPYELLSDGTVRVKMRDIMQANVAKASVEGGIKGRELKANVRIVGAETGHVRAMDAARANGAGFDAALSLGALRCVQAQVYGIPNGNGQINELRIRGA